MKKKQYSKKKKTLEQPQDIHEIILQKPTELLQLPYNR